MIDPTAELESVTAVVSESLNCSGILVFGSALTDKFDQRSDIDLICINDSDILKNVNLVVLDRWIDAVVGNQLALGRIIKKRMDGNNNYILRGLTFGLITLDRHEKLSVLQKEARFLWEQGPSDASPEESQGIVCRAQKISATLEKLFYRRPESRHDQEIASLELTQHLRRLVSDYCVMNRLWAMSLSSFARVHDRKYNVVGGAVREFCLAEGFEKKLRLVASLAEEIINTTGSQMKVSS